MTIGGTFLHNFCVFLYTVLKISANFSRILFSCQNDDEANIKGGKHVQIGQQKYVLRKNEQAKKKHGWKGQILPQFSWFYCPYL